MIRDARNITSILVCCPAFLFGFLGVICSLTSNSVAAASNVEIIALSGSQAPGTSYDFDNFSFLNIPDINAHGDVAFYTQLTNSLGTTIDSVWEHSETTGLQSVVLADVTSPNTPSSAGTFDRIDIPVVDIDNAGRVAFVGYVKDDLGEYFGYWVTNSENEIQLQIGGRDTTVESPLGPGFFVSGFGIPNSNQNGQLVTRGNYSGGSASGIFVANDSNEITRVALLGGNAPGVTANATFSEFGELSYPIGFNDSGKVSFYALTSYSTLGVWSGENKDNLSLVAQLGQQAPGRDGFTFDLILQNPITLNNGQTVFQAYLNDPSNQISGFIQGYWKGDGENLELIYATGDVTSELVEPSDISNDVSVNGNADIAFSSSYETVPGNFQFITSIWSGGSSRPLGLVASAEDEVPGVEGATWDFLEVYDYNDNDQVAFVGVVDAPGTIHDGATGYWAQNANGINELLVIEGGYIDVDQGPNEILKQVEKLYAYDSYSTIGAPDSFNDAGQFAFVAQFTDGTSGIFVSSVGTIPEPTTLLLVAVGFPISTLSLRQTSR